MSKELTQFLASTELFKGISLPDLENLLDHIELISFQAGDRLIQQGDPGDCLYILRYGELEISVTDHHGHEVVLACVGPGESVGEIALLTGEKRSASVCALTDAEVLRLHQTDFDELRQKSPDISAQFTNTIVSRLQQVELRNLLHMSDQFNGMCKEALRDLEAELEVILCPSGKYLINEGDDSDCMYIVLSGRLQAVNQHGGLLLEFGRGQCVGEMAIITGYKRTASVRAIRDSLLARLSREGFNRLLRAHPEAITYQFTGKIINRLWLQTLGQDRNQSNVANIAIIPASQEVPLTEFCDKFSKALSAYGATLHLNSQLLDSYLGPEGIAQAPLDRPDSVNIARWLNKQESNYRHIVYEADTVPSEWTERCLRQADRVLVVGQANATAKPGEIEIGLLRRLRYKPLSKSLALLHTADSVSYHRTHEWLGARDVNYHYHVFYHRDENIQRLARLLTGNGIGVILGGGGARGFAHIGGLKALRECGVPVDRIGGTSMGAIIAGMAALDWDYETMLRKASAFNYKLDYTFPALALTAGANITNGLKHGFGERRIEDAKINFFCVSTNLGRSTAEVHSQGLMWKSIRASSSVPGVYPPIVDGDRLLVDGGMVNNLPVDVMQAFEDIGTTVAFDVSGPVIVKTAHVLDGHFSGWNVLSRWFNPSRNRLEGLPSLVSTVMYAALTKSAETTMQTKDLADYYFCFPVAKYGLLEFDRLHDIAETGYQYIKERLSELLDDQSFDLSGMDLTKPEKK